MREFVRLPDDEVREHLSRGSYLTVDHRASQAFLHTELHTSPVAMRLYRELEGEGVLQHVNASDTTSAIAIYRHASVG